MLDDRRRTRFDATMSAMGELKADDVIAEVHCRMELEARCRLEATVADGRRGLLLAYFPDEVAFLANELIGGRDRAYLDAPGYLRRAQDDQLGR